MTVFTEGRRPGEHLVFDECIRLSREVVAMAAGITADQKAAAVARLGNLGIIVR